MGSEDGVYTFDSFWTPPRTLIEVDFCPSGGCGDEEVSKKTNVYSAQGGLGQHVDPTEIALDGSHIYRIYKYDLLANSGQIQMCPRTGCENGRPVVLADKQWGPSHLCSNDKFVFWINEGPGAIVRLRKD
jgi:hypothetical protein